ncbi:MULTISPECIES: nucleotidyltransferase [unclassified Pseudonocardia]|uniref:nucleotidyltransferase family protein n=1 Tax=unclassified Pseudonocardia TaxID=2619320 RepID=UPI0001FFDDB0|nr:nucleotidyltransferase [Pseudonocardia sp. Ae707_Ps1]OLM09136.1 DNA polymerase, beta domain protein region [Pseudonocardia sp. Ae707_Ps1]
MLIVAGRVVDRERLAAICQAYGVEHLELFGSAARDTVGPTGDIDILYTLWPGRTLGWEIDDLADELSELFGRPVDLVARRALHAKLRDHVLAEARPLYAA